MTDAFSPLDELHYWVGWRAETLKKKIPHNPNFPEAHADTTDPTTWATRFEAEGCARELTNGTAAMTGIGIVLGDLGDGYFLAGVDLDSSLDENRALAPWGAAILSVLQTYSEVSPSDRGLKAVFFIAGHMVRPFLDRIGVEAGKWGCKRAIPGLSSANHGPAVEIYFAHRYFTVTGRLWSNDHPRIALVTSAQLADLVGLIPRASASGEWHGGNGEGLDNSRSGKAWRAAFAFSSFEEMYAGLRDHADPDVREWAHEVDDRQWQRLWDRGPRRRVAKAQEREAELEAHIAQWPPLELPATPADAHDNETNWASAADEEPWPEMEAEAFHGLAGKIVDAIDPLSEADPVAVLAQFLVMAGSAFGSQAYCRVGNTRHHLNLYTVICGDTAKGRKGTSYDPVEALLREADPDWAGNCVKSGLSSGEGIIHAVHDDVWVREKVSHGKDNPPSYEDVLKFENIEDKRLLITEAEFASPISVMQRQGNSLSPVLRLAWDGRKLQTLTKHTGETATGAHVSMIGHITIAELRARLDQISMANGFGNRLLFVLARRSKELPFPGWLDDATRDRFAVKLGEILNSIVLRREITFRPETRDLWIAEYHELSAARPGLFGFLVARAEAQVLRLAMIYALLHETYYIEPAHLRAALAFWRYCEASAKYIFGDALGDPVADELLCALRQAGPDGMTRTDLRDLFQHHSQRLARALALLHKHGKARCRKRTGTGGRAAEIWVAV